MQVAHYTPEQATLVAEVARAMDKATFRENLDVAITHGSQVFWELSIEDLHPEPITDIDEFRREIIARIEEVCARSARFLIVRVLFAKEFKRKSTKKYVSELKDPLLRETISWLNTGRNIIARIDFLSLPESQVKYRVLVLCLQHT